MVVNLRSRRNRRDPGVVERLRRIVGDHGEVAATASLDEVRAASDRFRRAGIATLALSGGDGTNAVTLTCFREIYGAAPLPKVAILRGGTMNTVARGLGIPRAAPEVLLRRLLDVERGRRSLRERRRVVLDVAGRLGFLFGAGAVHGFMAEYYRAGGEDPSALVAARVLGHAAASTLVGGPIGARVSAPLVARIAIDGEPWAHDAYCVLLAGTVPEVGLGFRPFPTLPDGDDRFGLVAAHGRPTLVARRMFRVLGGRTMGPDCSRETVARELAIEPRDGVVEYMIDGDIASHEGPLVVKSGPPITIVWGD